MDKDIAKTIGNLAEQQGVVKENTRIAKAILAENFSPDIMERLYKIILRMILDKFINTQIR